MARKPRLHYPGAVYHVILRGNAGQDIFFETQDRNHFLALLQEGQEKYRFRLHAYCLMTNHLHLVLQVGDISLSRIMQNVSFRYTSYVNRCQQQVGHLFQGRYKALLIDADNYLLELVRYIHNNPVRAGLAQTPEDYPWSSHGVYLGRDKTAWLTTEWVLSQFSGDKKLAMALYRDFVMHGKEETHRREFYHGNIEGRVLGEDHFAEAVFTLASQEVPGKPTLDQVLQAVCTHHDIHLADLSTGGKQRRTSIPRAMAALLVRETPHLSLMDLSRRLGRDLSGLSQAASRLDKLLKEDKELANDLIKIKKMIAKHPIIKSDTLI